MSVFEKDIGPDMIKIELAEWQRLKRMECEYIGFRAAVELIAGHPAETRFCIDTNAARKAMDEMQSAAVMHADFRKASKDFMET